VKWKRKGLYPQQVGL